jgi:hypothetical protein
MGQMWERVWFLGSNVQWLKTRMKDAEEKVKQETDRARNRTKKTKLMEWARRKETRRGML